jgi:predicted nuclease with TOPRIM domain
MISLKDYASKNNISYEAVRQQVKRFEKELVGHITQVGRTRFLDDEAERFLDERRKTNPVVVLERSKDEEVERLEQENKMLLLKVAKLQDELIEEKEQVKVLQGEKIALLEEQKHLPPVEDLQRKIEELTEQVELEKSKSWWDKLRRK